VPNVESQQLIDLMSVVDRNQSSVVYLLANDAALGDEVFSRREDGGGLRKQLKGRFVNR